MLQLSWSSEGRQELSRTLQNIGNEVKDWTPAFKEAAAELSKIFANDSFATQGRVFNEPWPPLKPKYLAQKVAQGFPADPLIKTGKMQKSMQSLYKSDIAEIWNSVYYFKYHQSFKPRKVLPRRAMMKLGENQKQLVIKIFHTYWHKKITGAIK